MEYQTNLSSLSQRGYDEAGNKQNIYILASGVFSTYSKAVSWTMGCNVLLQPCGELFTWLYNWIKRRQTFDHSLVTPITCVHDTGKLLRYLPRDVKQQSVSLLYNYLYSRADIGIVLSDSRNVGSRHELFRDWSEDMYEKWFNSPYACLFWHDLNTGRSAHLALDNR